MLLFCKHDVSMAYPRAKFRERDGDWEMKERDEGKGRERRGGGDKNRVKIIY